MQAGATARAHRANPDLNPDLNPNLNPNPNPNPNPNSNPNPNQICYQLGCDLPRIRTAVLAGSVRYGGLEL